MYKIEISKSRNLEKNICALIILFICIKVNIYARIAQ